MAIAALGSLMYFKNKSEWNEIKNNENWSPSNNPKLEGVKSILLLSFYDLPYQLKHCFLYCSLYPDDHEIRRKRLIKLWMAKGFVEPIEGTTLEEEANRYLVKFTFRNMLQVVRRNEFGRPDVCKMHDLLRELTLSISVKEKFGAVHGGGEMKECKARRILIHKTNGELKSFTGMSKIRSLRMIYELKSFTNDFRFFLGMQAPSNITQLKNLQSVGVFEAKGDLIRQIWSMTQLATICIDNVKETDETDLCISIENMRLLRVLGITVTNEEETLRMDALSSPPPHLQKLLLTGKLKKVPQWFFVHFKASQICDCIGRD